MDNIISKIGFYFSMMFLKLKEPESVILIIQKYLGNSNKSG